MDFIDDMIGAVENLKIAFAKMMHDLPSGHPHAPQQVADTIASLLHLSIEYQRFFLMLHDDDNMLIRCILNP